MNVMSMFGMPFSMLSKILGGAGGMMGGLGKGISGLGGGKAPTGAAPMGTGGEDFSNEAMQRQLMGNESNGGDAKSFMEKLSGGMPQSGGQAPGTPKPDGAGFYNPTEASIANAQIEATKTGPAPDLRSKFRSVYGERPNWTESLTSALTGGIAGRNALAYDRALNGYMGAQMRNEGQLGVSQNQMMAQLMRALLDNQTKTYGYDQNRIGRIGAAEANATGRVDAAEATADGRVRSAEATATGRENAAQIGADGRVKGMQIRTDADKSIANTRANASMYNTDGRLKGDLAAAAARENAAKLSSDAQQAVAGVRAGAYNHRTDVNAGTSTNNAAMKFNAAQAALLQKALDAEKNRSNNVVTANIRAKKGDQATDDSMSSENYQRFQDLIKGGSSIPSAPGAIPGQPDEMTPEQYMQVLKLLGK